MTGRVAVMARRPAGFVAHTRRDNLFLRHQACSILSLNAHSFRAKPHDCADFPHVNAVLPSTETIPTIAIVGGGVAGTLVAANLLRLARSPVRIRLFERMSGLGRGVAYGTRCPAHLLNVPAGRMGAYPDQIDHFFKWVSARVGQTGFPNAVATGDFLPRQLYGDYTQAVLEEARAGMAAGVDFETIKGEITDIETESGSLRLRCGDGRGFDADQVVLAIGNLPGEYPIRSPLPIYHSQLYVHVPWIPGALAGIPSDSEVLIVGAGLTAIDIMLELTSAGHRGTIHALSRRGLLPQAHKPSPPYPDFLTGSPLPATVLELSRRLRAEVRHAAAAGIDWRPVLDAIRPHSQALWQGFSWEERGRFMRHVRPFWEVHRHRVAPPVAARVEELRAAGQVIFYAGRLSQLVDKGDAAAATFRFRSSQRTRTVRVARVINCTGPRTDYSKYRHPLLINLLARGLIGHDPLALGVRATAQGEVLSYAGDPVGWLHSIGAPLKGDLWECTAVPEIRAQARMIAERLLANPTAGRRRASPAGSPAASSGPHDVLL